MLLGYYLSEKKNFYQRKTIDLSCIRVMCLNEVYTVNKGLVINYGEGGYKMGKLRVRKVLWPPL